MRAAGLSAAIERLICMYCRAPMRLHKRQRVWWCPQCGAAAVTLAAAKAHRPPKFISRVWRVASDDRTPLGQPCSVCAYELRSVQLSGPRGEMTFNVCRCCLLIWFSPGEFGTVAPALPPRLAVASKRSLE